jgi:hypothetical protein
MLWTKNIELRVNSSDMYVKSLGTCTASDTKIDLTRLHVAKTLG